jgi:hypothetical protein
VFLAREPEEQRAGRFAPSRSCWFCDRASGELRCRMVCAGVCICEDCVQSAAAALSAIPAGARRHEAAVGRERCGLCGKGSGIEAPLGGGVRLLSGPRTAICHECVALCINILDDKEERDPRPERLQRWVRDLSSPNPFFRCLAAVALGDWGLANEPAARQALWVALADTDWRVRALAEATLSKTGGLPDGYRPSFIGRLQSLDFMHIYFGEQPSATERDASVVDSGQ